MTALDSNSRDATQPKVLTIDEAAQLLRISRGSAYEAARMGEIPIIRLGRRLLVPRAKLLQMLGEDANEPV